MSVIVPAYNAARTLGDTLRSVLGQTFTSFEVVVVDDGSTDETIDVARDFALADPRVRIVRQANGGVAAARNKGVAAAVGDFVATIDADDLWHPEKIERQMAAMERPGPPLGFVYCWSRRIDRDGLGPVDKEGSSSG